MKKGLIFFGVVFLLISCGEQPTAESSSVEVKEEVVEVVEENKVYPYFAGAEFNQETAVSEEELVAAIQSFEGGEMEVSFNSEIIDNCEKKGCWMHVKAGDEKVRVSFKDYDFFVPLDAAGHKTTLNGVLFYDTLTVEQLKHFAMDANASQDSIDGISEPVITLSYEATGVYVQ